MTRSRFLQPAIVASFAACLCLTAGSAQAKDFPIPIDSLAGFTLGQTWDEVKATPGFEAAPHLDSKANDEKGGHIRKTTVLGLPVRTVMLFFKGGKLIRVHLMQMEGSEDALLKAMIPKYGDPRPAEKYAGKDAFIWKGRFGRIVASGTPAGSTKWRVVLRPLDVGKVESSDD